MDRRSMTVRPGVGPLTVDQLTGCSSAWTERSPWKRDDAGSNPAAQTNNLAIATMKRGRKPNFTAVWLV